MVRVRCGGGARREIQTTNLVWIFLFLGGFISLYRGIRYFLKIQLCQLVENFEKKDDHL
jgi:hypothetical protein